MEPFFKLTEISAKESLSLIELNSIQKQNVKIQDSFYNFTESFNECSNHSHLFICCNKPLIFTTYSIDTYPTLFLEFADLDLSNRNELAFFILKYGFLTDNQKLIKLNDSNAISLVGDNSNWSNIDSHKILEKEVYSEPLLKWVLLQIHVRRLIRYWRALRRHHMKKIKLEVFFSIKKENPLIIEDEVSNYFTYYFSAKNKFININQIKKDFNNPTFKEINVSDYFKIRYSGIASLNKSQHYRISNNEAINFLNDYLFSELNSLLKNQSHDFKTLKNFKTNDTLLSSINTTSGTQLVYNSLMGGILYQLSNSISLDKKFKRCLECQKWIEFSIQGRIGKKYCCSNCRGSAHRRRESIKLLYEMADLQGNFSLKKHFNNFCISFNKGADEFLNWRKKFNDEFSDKQKVRSLLNNIIENILNNLNVYTSTKSIAEHLELEHDYIKSINLNEAFKVAASKHKIIGPYTDWDFS